ncbi:MAG: methylenetetrahydrofolate--tRNA-(uracil(54)-C(5))-methyltransferase (FADH(2)-oxidizing) TrmFO [Anaeromusa sp.]|uniref:methylenetetrahydrofolate--tRNA-(uracil(54)- C(5))-methyltransferase (FADH(2)-oxidizing) TrmFO n=1 Tax=Anaeromusa sp. TaxID=1872520 RepID=UPI002617F8B1|nr:methylenetetrahydrofolate--tRNA-(uracil(54)-C(5))-methyltransferase (FADH(2)-oxidizing) TrmFO [Anaeromusa sp.]MDD3157523.1 methylenetetrahydrofolate--tRNA-(uracil(54)-C(5))-methyltransferase (FADH(2)-oxidizing) TrmFO [Anaeromusa sp.]MEA4834296.1 methylenetetrahydrofolate--tRNA-(uracil(54)-C(5))-methyltransferase (FADH(2)-oxidizing) TrmFO [Anaeromusa sp.]NCB76730.1 methylenetetrahydrofolate--tRNA-(uracil(54)-C(5))-methyltransferase (FADH(2)-oxidizing) TrmFO [Negativicutes bacterium]
MKEVVVIGAGLAGSEAAWQIAQAGVRVRLYEMRPSVPSPAHSTPWFAELVCSNSLRAAAVENAVGLLKEEMRQLNSLILQQADAWRLPAGGALAVDREGFSRGITEAIRQHPLITVVEEEVKTLPVEAEVAVIASGPLTAPALSEEIQRFAGSESLYFYDAAAPIVHADSLDMEKIYRASRYDKGDADYLNCPMEKEEYEAFWQELTQAETAPVREFEKTVFFEGCMPVEAMAARGIDTLRFGPLKPVGLPRPDTGRIPYAVVQLRQDNTAGTLYNLVGFQTHLRWPEQERVFRMIPGLEQAQFVRFGVMHRNTFINSPKVLLPTLQAKERLNWLFAGQLTGVEGYVESAAAGLVAGLNAARLAKGKEPLQFPRESAHGALCHYITHAESKHFQPMNINFGLLPPLEERIRDKKIKNQQIAQRALICIKKLKEKYDNILA